MPNHGYCKRCWWWKSVTDNKGICYMQSAGHCRLTKDNDYCPDYLNRKKGDKERTLDEWLVSTKIL